MFLDSISDVEIALSMHSAAGACISVGECHDDYVKAMCVSPMSLFVITVSLKGWGSCMESYCIHLSPILNGGSSEVERF